MGFIPVSSQGPRDSGSTSSTMLAVQNRYFESCIEGTSGFGLGDFLNQTVRGKNSVYYTGSDSFLAPRIPIAIPLP